MERPVSGTLLLSTLITLFSVGCGEAGIEGAWAECRGDCFAVDDDGFLLRDDGSAVALEVFDDAALVENTAYCARVDERALSWSLEGDQLKMVQDGEEHLATFTLNENRLTMVVDGNRFTYQRLNEDRDAGLCRDRQIEQDVPVAVSPEGDGSGN